MKIGLYFAFTAMLLQIAVFLQPLLPEKYEFAPVCDTIAEVMQLDRSLFSNSQELMSPAMHHTSVHEHMQHSMNQMDADHTQKHQHHLEHDCMFCSVFSHVIPVLNTDIQQVVDRIHIILLFITKLYKSFYFALQQLFLLPQNRAPPVLFS